MFCQNCGKDCTDARFCPECGQELSAAAEEKQVTNIRSRIPLGKYKASCCSLELKEEGLVVHNTFARNNKTTYIPYGQLKKVLYIRTYNAIEDAYLVLRWEGNEQLPIPEGTYMSLDDTTVRIVDHMVEHLVFYHIFYLLKLLAPAAGFRIENGAVNIPNLEKLEKDHDIAPYFEEYNPYKQVATKMLRKDTGMKKKAAKVLIDRYFDSQHKVLYADNAEAIHLDLDKAIKGVLCTAAVRDKYRLETEVSNVALRPKCRQEQFVSTPESEYKKQIPLNLEDYYKRYRYDREQAIIALRIDTGMNAVSAKREIDKIFNAHEKSITQSTHTQGATSDEVFCPKCFSNDYTKRKATYRPWVHVGHYRSPVVNLVANIFRLVFVISNSMDTNQVEYVCKNCKHTWLLEEK